MSNFKQICRIKTNFKTKEPEIEMRENGNSRHLIGKITWLDGQKPDGTKKYEWFNFAVRKDELVQLILKNPGATFEVEGFLKNKNWQNEKGEWINRCEIFLTNVVLYHKDKPIQSFQEKDYDNEIPF